MEDRFAPQMDLVPQTVFKSLGYVTVAGVGAVGRQVALQLASLGIPRIRIVDFDTVEDRNITTQGYFKDNVGMPKVSALASEIDRIDSGITVDAVNDRMRPKHIGGHVLFCCVDRISTRQAIWKQAKSQVRLFIDVRMLGEVIRVLAFSCGTSPVDYEKYNATSHIAIPENAVKRYEETLFSEEETFSGRCTAHGTIYTACSAAATAVKQFVLWSRGGTPREDIWHLMASDEIIIQQEANK